MAAVVIVSSVCVGPLQLNSQVLNDEKGKYVHIVARSLLVHLIRDISYTKLEEFALVKESV